MQIIFLLIHPYTYRRVICEKSNMISVWLLGPKQNVNLYPQRREILSVLMNSLGESLAKPHKAVSS